MKKYICFILPFFIFSCKDENPTNSKNHQDSILKINTKESFISEKENKIIDRYSVPKGFQRENYNQNEFGYFLQHLQLKNFGTLVKYYNGKEKPVNNVYNAVIDLPIGNKDLHQCADATMRLRANYLYLQKRYDEISFNFLSDGKPRKFTDFASGDYSPENYWRYLEYIFSYANTTSLKNQLESVKYNQVKIGDILLQQGNPYGHAVMVVDFAKNEKGEKIVLLAQSYMPAQEIQILNNPMDKKINPWYKVQQGKIKTPEWLFTSNDWKTWD
ncbi:DUF4846 domain-containing protein [Empedobacter tilapiae]|uniref:DUF4846 domain-containing protein n=1 Tax=Empedobacter tilapiae TaxID=2491114 RepID=UPI0028D1E492|nr:DUF4846 domain-containing protein [Empedobacter tilapiae]